MQFGLTSLHYSVPSNTNVLRYLTHAVYLTLLHYVSKLKEPNTDLWFQTVHEQPSTEVQSCACSTTYLYRRIGHVRSPDTKTSVYNCKLASVVGTVSWCGTCERRMVKFAQKAGGENESHIWRNRCFHFVSPDFIKFEQCLNKLSLYPTTLLPLVWPVWQKSRTEQTASTCCQLHSVYILCLREMQ